MFNFRKRIKLSAQSIWRYVLTKKMSLFWIVLFWVSAAAVLSASKLGRYLEYQNARQLEFQTRDLLGLSPSIDSRVRIFAFDDKTIAWTKAPEPSLSDWTAMLRSLRLRQPRVILIDKVFGYIPPSEAEDVDDFLSEIKLHSNLVVGAFLTSQDLPLRPKLDLSGAEFTISEESLRSKHLDNWLPMESLQVYGPQPDIAKNLKMGHLLAQREGLIHPWLRIQTNKAVPHLGIKAAEDARIDPHGPSLKGRPLPVDRNGKVWVNFTSKSLYFQAVTSMRSLLLRAREGQPISDVNQGDVVILLPLMYTGNTDFTDTPMGRIPGGLVHASLVSSTLNDEWLRPALNGTTCLVLLTLLGAILGTIVEPKWFWPGLIAVFAALTSGSLLTFAYGGLILPWFFPCFGFLGAALTMQGTVNLEQRENARRVSSALSGLVPQDKLAAFIDRRSVIAKEPQESVVSVMFLDISNFSTTALQMRPKEVFLHLQTIMTRITASVHKHGGIVDRTMGDGLLCFFGYSYDGKSETNHADAAILCAQEIQQANVRHCIESKRAGTPIWPFRLGINTTAAFIGDLGNEDRIDFTLIGSGVNLAQRLEAACPLHSIMISLTTFDLSTITHDKSVGIHRCKIKIKNSSDLLDCMEIDPLARTPDLRIEATNALRQFLALERNDERWPVISTPPLTFSSLHGDGELIDFSKSGVCISLGVYLAKGVSVTFDVSSDKPDIDERLKRERLQKFRCEVRWGRQKNGRYLHGFQFNDLNEAQQQALFDLLRDACAVQKTS